MSRWASVCLLLLFSGALPAQEAVYKLTGANCKVTFVGTKPGGKHDGGFKEVKGTIVVKDGELTAAKIKVDIDVNSIYTDTQRLTNHLKTPDFFDSQKYPKATFESTKIEKAGDNYIIHGKLTMRGVTKELHFPASIQATNHGVSLESQFQINRHDWRISYGKNQVDDMVKLSLKVTAAKS
jgi:polyisoprenoid-binding protein YceI